MDRIEKLTRMLDSQSLDAFYITHLPNIRYLTKFSGSSGLVILTRTNKYFITDFRYKEQSAMEVKGFDIIINYDNKEEVKAIFKKDNLRSVGFEASHLSYSALENNKKNFDGVKFVPLTDEIEKLTVQKTPEEIESVRKAIEITDLAFSKVLEIIKPGVKELDISAEITYMHKKFGALKDSFEPIIASGWRGALPHGIASDKIIKEGEMVTLDIGCQYNGFSSDMTRTVSVGKPSDEMKKIYDIVFDSQQMGIEKAKAGITSKQLDSVSRNYINSKGYSENFGHGLGHGLGIEVHEMPGLNQRTEVPLLENSIVTIEPGIYIDNIGGVRIEDDVLLNDKGCEVLNKSPKDLIIL
ncbi:MAG: Xaa-Pro peptidase family protein [Ignavibacteria bacterium]|jgi:Xaa-Pro aminopeptidase